MIFSRSADFAVCCIAGVAVGENGNPKVPVRWLGNRRYGRLGSLLYVLLMVAALPCLAAKSDLNPPPELDPVEGAKQARALLDDLLSRTPEENTTNSGVLILRDARNKKKEIPTRFEVVTTPTHWINVFETLDGTAERLVITHTPNRTNVYELFKHGKKKSISGDAMFPFAGSDFWAVDLGLEFLHWPKQRLIRKEMFRSQFCGVLESSGGPAGTNSYSRVVCWIDMDSGAIVKGEAYDGRNQLLKRFDPTEIKRVEGKFQLEAMEMRNRRTGTRSEIKFDLKK